MCVHLTHPDDLDFGQLWSLCANATAHILEIAGIQLPPRIVDENAPEVVELAPAGMSPNSVAESLPGANLFGAFTTLAETLLIEEFYFDLDTRSEVAVLQESTFATVSPSALRYHFFSVPVEEGARLRDYVVDAKSRDVDNPVGPYLGYSVIRPKRPIGRTIVPPFAQAFFEEKKAARTESEDGAPAKTVAVPAATVYQQVRTAVSEHVNLFGVPLTAVGVPFMEQDGSLLRCAHISAWICHYSAVLRGAVARRPTADFPKVGDWKHATGRQFPSGGLTSMELSAVLRNLDMPPELLDYSVLSDDRDFTWADRTSLKETIEAAQKKLTAAESSVDESEGRGERRRRELEIRDDAEAALRYQWVRENLSAAICRYLNSGIPVILIRDEIAHTQVVVGYLRKSDLVPSADDTAGDHEADDLSVVDVDAARSDIDMFIVTDDQYGPFELVTLDKLATEVMQLEETQLLAPLPLALWMSGDVAERTATSRLPSYVDSRLGRLDKWAKATDPELQEELRETLTTFRKNLDAGANKYTIRTYATTGVDLKQSVAKRLDDAEDLVRRLNTVQLPKYVWVAELIDRDLRANGESRAVMATVVLDATKLLSAETPAETQQQALPLFLQFPGHVYVAPYSLSIGGVSSRVTTEEDIRDVDWSLGPVGPYPTGRWSHERLSAHSAERLANQAKTAVTVS